MNVPVNADFEGGYAVDPQQVAENVKLAAATGIAGLSIEDSTGDEADPLLRVRPGGGACAGRATGDRREWHRRRAHRPIRGIRVRASRHRRDDPAAARVFAEAGADCLYAPRIDRIEHITAIVAAVSPKPVNLLINAPFMTVAEAADLGVRRISVGGTLARTAWGGFLQAAQRDRGRGTFSRFERLPNVDALFRAERSIGEA